MKSYPRVSVIIVNYNSGQLLQKVLIGLDAQYFKDFSIIVVDNNSTDDSLKVIETTPSLNITVIKAGENLGFARANNLAAERANTDFLLFLNPDAVPAPDCLQEIVAYADCHSEYDLFGACLLCANNPDYLDGIGDIYHISGLTWRSGHGRKATNSLLVEKEIFSPCAAAALVTNRAFSKLGGFDEDLFCYIEDVDFGFRARLAGYRSVFVPNAQVLHVGSAITGKKSDFSVYHGHRNMVWVYTKNMPGILFWLCLPLHVGLNIFSILWFSVCGRWKVIVKAKLDAIKGIPRFWKKRKFIQSNRKVQTREILRWMNKDLYR